MYTYRHVKAIEAHRFAREGSQMHRDRIKRQSSLADLVGAIAAGLASLGMRGSWGRNRPPSPAY